MLSKEQLQFLSDEFGLTSDDIQNLSIEQWKKIKLDCFRVSFKESVLDDDDEIIEKSPKGILASSILDLRYSDLKEKDN